LDRGTSRALTPVQADYQDIAMGRGGSRNAAVELALESERVRLVCHLDDRRAHLLRACGRSEGQKGAGETMSKEAREAKRGLAIAIAGDPTAAVRRPPKVSNGLPDEAHLANPFWIKLRDSLLTAEEKAVLAANPLTDKSAIVGA